MEQSPSWEANSHSANQKTPRPIWNSNVYYRVHKSCHGSLSQMNPVHISLRPILVLSSYQWLGLPSSIFLLVSLPKLCILVASFHACYIPRPSHPPWLRHPNIWWSVQVMKLFTVQFSPAFRFSRQLDQNILFSTPKLCSQTPSVYVLSLALETCNLY
jgi:hypothetical protein